MMFETAWWSFDLGSYRPCDSTYCWFDYDALPPLNMAMFDGEFGWLMPLDQQTQRQMELHRMPKAHEERMAKTLVEIQASGLTLPPGFVKFMGSPALQSQIPSCTACYFDLSQIIPSPFEPDAYLIRFLNDQQDVLLWYVYLRKDGSHFVVVSASEPFELEQGGSIQDVERMKSYFQMCAPTFESFIYRFWIENVIWFALNEAKDASLTATQQAYVNHYHK